jgi:F-type H+-transporting ATPase subunit c
MKNRRLYAGLLAFAFVTIFSIMLAFSGNTKVQAAEENTAAATEAQAADSTGSKAIAAGIVVGLAAAAGAIGMGIAVAKSAESMARQPEIAGKINSTMMLGMVFIETAIIYALIVAILIIFVL